MSSRLSFLPYLENEPFRILSYTCSLRVGLKIIVQSVVHAVYTYISTC